MRSSLIAPAVVFVSCVAVSAAPGAGDQNPALAAITSGPAPVGGGVAPSGPKRLGGGPEKPEIKFPLPPAPVLSPAEQIRTFKLPPGFRAELVASEPMIQSPVAMSFDDQGRAVFFSALKVVADGWRPCHKAGPGVQAKTNHPL